MVDGIGRKQFLVTTDRIDLAIIHHNNTICILNRGNPLTNDDFGRLFQAGCQSLTDDGAGLSNGQRQLIAIARAALANAPVLILDEATSSIDSRTEKMVQEGMDRLMEGRTVFVIAHRLSTIVNSDVIMVMDHGRIIERGNHASLMAERGTYYRLYTGGLEID